MDGLREVARATIPVQDLVGEGFLRAVTAIGGLMAEGSTGPPVTDPAYTSRVTGRALEVLTLSGAWLAQHAER